VDEPADLARLRLEMATRLGEPEIGVLSRLVERVCSSPPA